MKKTIIASALLIAAQGSFAALTATVNLTQQDALLTAHIVINQDQSKPGMITVDWRAPQGTGCQNSTYPLTYQYKIYHTWATRTVVKNKNGQLSTCTGIWTVNVVAAQNGQLATASFDVRPVANTQLPNSTLIAPAAATPAKALQPVNNQKTVGQANQVPAMNLTKPTTTTSQPLVPVQSKPLVPVENKPLVIKPAPAPVANTIHNHTLNPLTPTTSTANPATEPKPVNTLSVPAGVNSDAGSNNSTSAQPSGNNNSR